LLIPFIENAFKYVSDHDEQENFIKVSIELDNSGLTFSSTNTFDEKVHQQKDNIHKGIGLINLKKRLELIYRNKYTLKEVVNNGIYHVTLTLNLK
jgi:sensor histidine kinase YesM